MGEPVRIIDLARRHDRASRASSPDRDIEIEVIGIRPGEKLHEELFNVDEEVRPTRYGKIMRATRPAIDPSACAAAWTTLVAPRRRRPTRAGRVGPLGRAQQRGAGRVGDGDGEGQGARPSTTHGERQ